MNDIQIQYFIDLNKTLNFTKTAENLFVSQPAVSKQIISLEKELGFQLFQRTNKGVSLTQEGKLFYNFFLESSQKFQRTVKEANRVNSSKKKTVVIGLLEAWDISIHLSSITNSISTHYPNILMEFVCYNHYELRNKILNNDIDIAISLADIFKISNLKKKEITSIPSLVFYTDTHPLAVKTGLTLKDFKDETFFLFEDQANIDTKERVIEQCRPNGFVPKIETVPNIQSMIFNVINGAGVAIFDDWMQYKLNPRLKHIKTGYSHQVIAVWNDTSLDKFVHYLTEYFRIE